MSHDDNEGPPAFTPPTEADLLAMLSWFEPLAVMRAVAACFAGERHAHLRPALELAAAEIATKKERVRFDQARRDRRKAEKTARAEAWRKRGEDPPASPAR